MMNESTIGRRLLWFAALFAVMFAARLAVGYRSVPDAPRPVSSRAMIPDISADIASARHNYAIETADTPDGGVTAVYERTAQIVAASREYDRDVRDVRAAIAKLGGAVQSERDVRRSDVATRALFIAAAMPPDALEQAIEAVRAIGRTQSTEVSRADRTEEYLAAASERAALEETHRAMAELRRTSTGTMDDRAELERRILDVDSRLQSARVRASAYEGADRATIFVTIYEERDMFVAPPSFERRAMIAFKWAAKYSLALTAALALFSVFTILASAAFARLADMGRPSARARRTAKHAEAPREMPARYRLEAGDGKDDKDESNSEEPDAGEQDA